MANGGTRARVTTKMTSQRRHTETEIEGNTNGAHHGSTRGLVEWVSSSRAVNRDGEAPVAEDENGVDLDIALLLGSGDLSWATNTSTAIPSESLERREEAVDHVERRRGRSGDVGRWRRRREGEERGGKSGGLG